MAVTELTFTQQTDGTYTSSFTTTGTKTALQINRELDGELYLTVSADDGEHEVMYGAPKEYKNAFYEFDLPAGILVSVISFTDVTYGATVDNTVEDNNNVG